MCRIPQTAAAIFPAAVCQGDTADNKFAQHISPIMNCRGCYFRRPYSILVGCFH
jgi:hypothetical protein